MLQKEEFHPPAHVIWRLADTVGGLKPNKVQQIKIANSTESFKPSSKFLFNNLPSSYNLHVMISHKYLNNYQVCNDTILQFLALLCVMYVVVLLTLEWLFPDSQTIWN